MEFNGKKPSSKELFGNIDFDSLPEFEEKQEEKKDFNAININANIPTRFKNVTFNDIDKTLADKVRNFALKDSDNVFLLFGECGLGKTSAMCAAIHERFLKGFETALYFSVRLLMPTLRNCRSFSAHESEINFYRTLSTVPFLCIDEVGTCPVPSEEREFLSTVIATRYDNMLPVFISTNLSPLGFKGLITGVDVNVSDPAKRKELSQQLDKEYAILNRIKSVAITHNLIGESYRTRGLYAE